jgi:hypothetical protein
MNPGNGIVGQCKYVYSCSQDRTGAHWTRIKGRDDHQIIEWQRAARKQIEE